MVNEHRKKLIRREIINDLRFLTFSCYQRYNLFNSPERFQCFVDTLNQSRVVSKFKLVGWVVMPNHVHLMIKPFLPEYPVSKILHNLKRNASVTLLKIIRLQYLNECKMITDRSGRQHFWQHGGGYDRNINSQSEYEQKLNYMHYNPVKSGLVPSIVDLVVE